MKKDFDLVAFLFWIVVVFYLDPGGIVKSNVAQDVDSVRWALFKFGSTALFYWFLFIRFNSKENMLIQDRYIQLYSIIIIVWSLYYFLWFYGLNNASYISPYRLITRNERIIGQILIVFPIAYFASIRLDYLVNILSWTTIFIMLMFILSIFTNLELIEIIEGNRGMGLNATRYFMEGYGFMSFTVPMALSLLMMKYKNNRIIIVAAIFVSIQFFLSILRKEIIGIIEYSIIIAFFVNYINKSKAFNFVCRFINIKSISVVFILFVIIYSLKPAIIETAQVIADNTYRKAILGEVVRGEGEDVRLSLTAQYQTVKAIQENILLGTGFNNEWLAEGSGGKGYEGSDYIFLSVFAMYGLFGLLLFLPFYIITVKLILRFLKLVRNNLEIINKNKNILIYPVIVGLASSSEFIKNIIEYPNWFYPIGATRESPKYWIYFGLLVGSYYQIKKFVITSKLKKYQE